MSTRILFSTSPEWLSWVIRFRTFSRWSHCELLRDDGLLLGADYPSGVDYGSLERRIQLSTRWEICEVPGADEDAVWSWARQHLGKPYDLKGAIGLGLGRDWQDPDQWWCSELVAGAHLAADVTLVRRPRSEITQQDIYQSPRLVTRSAGLGALAHT